MNTAESALEDMQNAIVEPMIRSLEEALTAPWTDFAGNTIMVGDSLEHPDGTRFVVNFDDSREDDKSKWRAVYEDGQSWWLGNQIGDKGMAVRKP